MNGRRCMWCADEALDGHLTCGDVRCSESEARDQEAARWRDSRQLRLFTDTELPDPHPDRAA